MFLCVNLKDFEKDKLLINNKIRNNISIIDIEPGFFSFYKKADKISDVFKYLSKTFEFDDMKFGYNFKVNK